MAVLVLSCSFMVAVLVPCNRSMVVCVAVLVLCNRGMVVVFALCSIAVTVLVLFSGTTSSCSIVLAVLLPCYIRWWWY